MGIAKALDLDVIVEGAETAAQIELLDDLDCHVVQGFYYGRPTEGVDFCQSPEVASAELGKDRRLDADAGFE